MKQCIIVLGGSSEIALECLKLWCSLTNNFTIFLIGRDENKLKSSSIILSSFKNEIKVFTKSINCLNVDEVNDAIKEIATDYQIDKVLFAIGMLTGKKSIKGDKEILEINGISPIIFSQACIPFLNKNSHLIFLSSVASDRARKSNFLYGAGKNMLSVYVQGLLHKYHKKEFHITLVKLGPTKTKMLKKNNKKILFAANLEDVSKMIIKAVSSKRKIIYIPAKWKYIMFIVRSIPKFIFNRMDF